MTEPLRIVVRRGQEVVSTHAFDEDVVKIGRAPKSHVPLQDDAVSRMHAVVERVGAGWQIIDLGSSAGTRVGGRPVNKCSLAIGDVIEIGPFTLELLSGGSSGESNAPSPAPSKPAPQCPGCGSVEPRVSTELHTTFTAPQLAFDAPDMITRVRAELCPACGHIGLFLRDPRAVVPRE